MGDAMASLGLALSGGGFRATFFHLGVVRWLCESGLLPRVRHITSVSGGSILAAHLVLNWDRYVDPERFEEAAEDLRRFARLDPRGRILRRLATHYPVALIRQAGSRVFRSRNPGTLRNQLFEGYLKRHLYGGSTLQDVADRHPGAPTLEILATNLSWGSLSFFSASTYWAGSLRNGEGLSVKTNTPLAHAVAISAAFPGFFPTTEVTADHLLVDPSVFPHTIYLTDGGVYDNLGIRRFKMLRGDDVDLDRVLVCDASGHFDWLVGRETLTLLKTALRSSEILMKRLAEVEREAASMGAEPWFVHLPISDIVEGESGVELLPVPVQDQLKNIRTDLDRFSSTEIACLERHGYEVAAGRLSAMGTAAHRSVTPTRIRGLLERPGTVAEKLRRGRFRKLRYFAPGDAVSYVYVALLLLLVVTPSYLLWSQRQGAAFFAELDGRGRDSYGMVRDVSNEQTLLKTVLDAHQRWPGRAKVQVEVALTSYALWTKATSEDVRAEALRLLADSLSNLEDDLPGLDQREKNVYHQLKGHYYLEMGERYTASKQDGEARRSYQNAYRSYRQYRNDGFPGLYALEFNLCNTAIELGRLGDALSRCQSSDRIAKEEGQDFWQARFLVGKIQTLQQDPEAAVAAFVEANRTAVKAREEASLRAALRSELPDLGPLCLIREFRDEFGELCTPAV